jgi:hypothetical protein
VQIGIGISPTLGRGAWSPAKLGSSLLGYWDAERLDLLTLDGSNNVTTWLDAIAAYAPTQGSSTLRPAYSATSFNGRPGITFDGVDDYLELASQPFPSGAAVCEIWALVDQTALVADATVRIAISYGGDASTARRGLERAVISSANQARISVGSGGATVSPANASVDFSGRHVVRARVGASASQTDVDGVAGSSLSVTPATGTSRVRIGAISNTSPSNYWKGVIAMAAITSSLTSDQAAQMLAYLKDRGGVA